MAVTETWTTRDRPILEAIVVAEQNGVLKLRPQALVKTTGLDEDQVQLGLKALVQAGYIGGRQGQGTRQLVLDDIRPLERARREVGQWPSGDATRTFLEMLEKQIAVESDPVQKSGLQKFLVAAKEVGQDVLTSVLTSVVKQTTGLS